MIRLIGLTKHYKGLRAVDDIHLEVRKGVVFGFLGPNGAGKTTTIKMMAGVLKPTAGKILIDGMDLSAEPSEVKRRVGFIPDRPFVYEKLTGIEFLRFAGGLYHLDPSVALETRIRELLRLFDLFHWGDELIESYSHGMKQRLTMASALIHKPKAIIVDEPMVGLDPRGARLVKDLFQDLASQGVTVFMSTHTLEIVEAMCTRVAIINKGEIIAGGSVGELGRLARMENSHLEPIFLKLTGGDETAA
jgi:ABC-2 type transport system ATP-binding protein